MSTIYLKTDGTPRGWFELRKIKRYAKLVRLPWRFFAARPVEADKLIEDGDNDNLKGIYARDKECAEGKLEYVRALLKIGTLRLK